MVEKTSSPSLTRRQSIQHKRVKFNRMYEPHLNHMPNSNEDHELVDEVIPEDEASTTIISRNNSRPSIHWGVVVEGDSGTKEQINTDAQHFDALFARSNAVPLPAPHPRCYSSCSPANVPQIVNGNTTIQPCAKSQPLLSSSPSSKPKQSIDLKIDIAHRQSVSSTSTPKSQQSNSSLARTKRKNFSLTHAAQTFLQATNNQNEQLEPLARSCSYKRPQSIKKYRQKKKETEKEKDQQHFSTRKYSTTATSHSSHSFHRATSDSFRKSITSATPRISAADLMAADELHDQWSNSNNQRPSRIGSLTLDQLKLPNDADEEVYLVRQFHTTSKGFVNRGDSFKRSFKRSGSASRRSSFRANPNLTTNDRTPSQEYDANNATIPTNEIRTSTHSLTKSSGINLNGILDSHFIDGSPMPSTIPLEHQDENEEEEDDDDPLVERIQTEDGRVHDIHVYQVYLLGVSGTGKCSLMRQFKTTEYRGIYDYSSSVEDDPDNTVSIMLDGVESRLHIINLDLDHICVKSSVTGDAYVVVYSITDRQSFQTAVQYIKNIRDNESANSQSSVKRHAPIILVGNKSDLVRKRAVTKEAARHAALKHDCKFIETSAAINDKVDDLLAGTLKQIRISQQIRNEQKHRLTVTNGSVDTNDSEAPILKNASSRKNSLVNRNSKNVFTKFLNVFRKKPSKILSDVENLNTGIG